MQLGFREFMSLVVLCMTGLTFQRTASNLNLSEGYSSPYILPTLLNSVGSDDVITGGTGGTDGGHGAHGQRKMCENVKPLFDTDAETQALIKFIQRKADLFHNQGGNLKTLQEFLDANIDTTYQKLGVDYTTRGASEPLPATESLRKRIIADFREHDTNGRGGYDQRTPEGKFSKNVPGVMDSKRGMVDVIEPVAGFEKWKVAMGPEGPKCKAMHTIHPPGKRTYEDKYMCNYENYKKEVEPTGTNTNTNNADHTDTGNCNIISIGSNDEWGFEGTVTDETTCVTHTFDCTITSPKRKPASEAVNFYSACIAAENVIMNDKSYETYGSLLQKAGITEAPTFLKMDVEGFEFDVLTAMLRDSVAARQDSAVGGGGGGAPDLLPQQISIELHYYTRMYDLPWTMRSRQTGELSMLFGIMYRLGGYLPVNYDFDEGCASCLEVLFVRVFC